MKKKRGHLIAQVQEGSIAEELELEAGDILIAVNDQEIEDVFDYEFLCRDTYLEMLVQKADGEEWLLEVEKDEEEDMGLVFESSLMSDYRSCTNKCIFCFIDQMPPGMRETLYFKDDDTRLSFLQGNYVSNIFYFYQLFHAPLFTFPSCFFSGKKIAVVNTTAKIKASFVSIQIQQIRLHPYFPEALIKF